MPQSVPKQPRWPISRRRGGRWILAAAYAAVASVSGSRSSAIASTSSTVSTGWNAISSRTCSGTSSRSPSFRLGRMTSLSPARCAARHLLLHAADREHPALERHLAGHTDRALHRVSESSDAIAVTIVTPALGPSLGTAPAGTCTWNRPPRFDGSIPSSRACDRT